MSGATDLGGGFAVYGIYPEFKEDYAFHIMYLNHESKEKAEAILADNFNIRTSRGDPSR